MPDEPSEVPGLGDGAGVGGGSDVAQVRPAATALEGRASERTVPEGAVPGRWEPERPDGERFEPEAAEPEAAEPDAAAADAVRAAERRRRLAEVFGDVLPESTRDDRPDGAPPTGADDRWYTENRPPHHGG